MQPLLIIFYLIFDGTTLYLIWRNRRKFRSQGLLTGIGLFVLGQSLSFLNPELEAFALATIVSSLAALLMSFAILRQEIINPLGERMSQVEAIHRVSLAITSQIALDTVLEQIAVQAAKWLRAEAAGIWLNRDGHLELTTVHNLPLHYVHRQLQLGQGVIGTVAQSRQSMHLENYRRDWQGVQDLPLARETFGSVIAAPLSYRDDTIGVLLVIAARDGRTFDRDDVYQLDLLGAQAAVAISNSHLFAEQRALAQEVEFSRSQMETVLSSTPSPVIAVNRKLEIIFTNLAARTLLEEAVSYLPSTLRDVSYLQDSIQSARTVLRCLKQSGHYSVDVSINGKVYLCTLTALRTGDEKGFVAILNDITQLKELDRMKNEMVRMTSHDLKNPLQAALANVDLARDELAQHPNSEIEQSLEVIERQLSRMNRIIRGILDVERARTGVFSFTPIDPSALLQHAVEELQHLIQTSGVSVSLSAPDGLSKVFGDAEQLKRAVVNILENALKFTPKGGDVFIAAEQIDRVIRISIKDSGVGIPAEVGDRVFERFYRVNQRGTEHITGSGLGLSLVKAVVEQHHGRVWFTGGSGIGTTFFIELPMIPNHSVLVTA
jgi:signal transduction histidine kinase